MSPEFRFSRKTKALVAAGAIMITGALADMGLRVQPRWEEIEGLAQSIAPSPTLEEKRNVQELLHVEQTAKQPLLPETYEYIKSVDERQEQYDAKLAELIPQDMRNEVGGIVAVAGVGVGVLLWSFGSMVEDLTKKKRIKEVNKEDKILTCHAQTVGGCPLNEGFSIHKGQCQMLYTRSLVAKGVISQINPETPLYPCSATVAEPAQELAVD